MPLWTGSEPPCSSTLDRVGRDGTLALVFARRADRTVLTHRRFTLPLQALEPLPLDGTRSVCMMLLNPTGGVLGGDRLTTDISLGPGTHVCVTTPSATKVYRTDGPAAVQETTIRVGDGATIEYVPDHIIPHPGSSFHQSLSVELGSGSRAILCDAFAIGRLARQERWVFAELKNQVTVTAGGRLRFLDRFVIRPGSSTRPWYGRMDGTGYLATITCYADDSDAMGEMVRECGAYLSSQTAVFGGASLLTRGGCMMRFLAASAVDLTATMHALWTLCRQHLLNLPEVNLRKY